MIKGQKLHKNHHIMGLIEGIDHCIPWILNVLHGPPILPLTALKTVETFSNDDEIGNGV